MTGREPHDHGPDPHEFGGLDDDLPPPPWDPGPHLPVDARRMGLSPHVPDGALLDFAGALDARKTRHRVTAWALLVVFGLPVLLSLLRLVEMAGD